MRSLAIQRRETRSWRCAWRWLSAAVAALFCAAGAGPALAQCYPIAQNPGKVLPAAYQPAALPAAGSVRLTFLGHSSFLIETPQGASAITDYNGLRGPEPPDIVTMNNAHSSHYTDFIDPKIAHVQRHAAAGVPAAAWRCTTSPIAICTSATCRPTCASSAGRA